MNLIDIDNSTEGTFFRCLHDEKPENPGVIELRRRWFDRNKGKGLRAKLLVREDGAVVGLCQYMPIEHSHLIGEDLFVILCIWVHGYTHLVGNQQGKGYGRFILEYIEKDVRESGAKGIAAWGMDFPHWNPVSFYEHKGYSRVDSSGPVVLVWKPFVEGAKPPALLRLNRRPPRGTKKTKVTVFINGWCGVGCHWCINAREAVSGLGNLADYEEIDTSDRANMLSWGIEDGVFLDDAPFYGPPLWNSDDLKREIFRVQKHKIPDGK